MARKLKVYAADIDGLHDWIVAAPNQADALTALGVNQNLFQQGRAAPTEDPLALEAALAAPAVPLRRLKGSKDAYQPIEADASSAWDKAAKAAGVGPRRKPVKAKRDRSRLDEAEAALRAFEATAKQEIADLDRRRKALLEEQAVQREDLRDAIAEEQRKYQSHG